MSLLTTALRSCRECFHELQLPYHPAEPFSLERSLAGWGLRETARIPPILLRTALHSLEAGSWRCFRLLASFAGYLDLSILQVAMPAQHAVLETRRGR